MEIISFYRVSNKILLSTSITVDLAEDYLFSCLCVILFLSALLLFHLLLPDCIENRT